MKTVVIHAPKDLRIENHAAPEQLGPNQVLVRVAAGGICGSDLHYYNHGGVGAIRLREPMILGHEVSGHVEALGADVGQLSVGQLVAVSPSRPCQNCRYCRQGAHQHCLNMQFYGSAMPFPHIQGAFREYLAVDVAQCAVADGLTAGEAAMAEPLAVCLHAVKQAGEMIGKRVLVTGCGPIGLLSIISARRAGAAEIVATDLTDFTLQKALENGADRVINMRQSPDGLRDAEADKGYFDILFECTGAEPALRAGIAALRPGGIIVQLGIGGDMSLPVQQMTAKELQLRGSFRFHEEFHVGVELMRKGLIDVRPLITQSVPVDEAERGFLMAADRDHAMKVQITF